MDTANVINKVITMFLLLCAGYVFRRLKWIDDRFSRGLSQLVICGAQPFMIVSKVIAIPYSADNLRMGGFILLISFAVHVLLAVFARLSVLPFRAPRERKIAEFSLLFVNCGFIGIPLMEAAFGQQGAFWCAIYVIAYNIIQFSYGLYLLGRVDPSIRMNPRKALINFGCVPCFIGIFLFVTGIGQRLPVPVTDAMNTIGNLCTPVTMLIIGGIVATIPPKKLFTCGKVYYLCALKLTVFPFAVALIGKTVGLPYDVLIFAVMIAALPSAANAGVFAEKYDIEPQFASHIVGMSTVLSAMTIPLVATFVQRMIV